MELLKEYGYRVCGKEVKRDSSTVDINELYRGKETKGYFTAFDAGQQGSASASARQCKCKGIMLASILRKREINKA